MGRKVPCCHPNCTHSKRTSTTHRYDKGYQPSDSSPAAPKVERSSFSTGLHHPPALCKNPLDRSFCQAPICLMTFILLILYCLFPIITSPNSSNLPFSKQKIPQEKFLHLIKNQIPYVQEA